MSRNATSFVLGYHGCSEEVGRKAVNEGLALNQSNEDFDWLGPGTYFWEGDPRRAQEWAQHKVDQGSYDCPFVVGAVIDLGNCLDLLSRDNIELLASAYKKFTAQRKLAGLPVPKNRDPRTVNKGDKLLRFRDCADFLKVLYLRGAVTLTRDFSCLTPTESGNGDDKPIYDVCDCNPGYKVSKPP